MYRAYRVSALYNSDHFYPKAAEYVNQLMPVTRVMYRTDDCTEEISKHQLRFDAAGRTLSVAASAPSGEWFLTR